MQKLFNHYAAAPVQVT